MRPRTSAALWLVLRKSTPSSQWYNVSKPPMNFCRESPGTRLPPLDRMREPVRRRAARALALLLAVGATRAAQIFVSPSGHDTHGDGSEASPFRSVQAAVDAALDFGEQALARLAARTHVLRTYANRRACQMSSCSWTACMYPTRRSGSSGASLRCTPSTGPTRALGGAGRCTPATSTRPRSRAATSPHGTSRGL